MTRQFTQQGLDRDLDMITVERDQILRWPDGDEKFVRLADLFAEEAALWKALFSSTDNRLHYRAAIRAAEYAAGQAKRWAARIADPAQTRRLEGLAA